MTTRRPLIVTAGEPAGIGPDLCVAIAGLDEDFVVVGDPGVLAGRAEATGASIRLAEVSAQDPGVPEPGLLRVIPFRFPEPVHAGRLNPANSKTLLDGLRFAVEQCQSGRFAAIVTAPLQKSVINDACIPFSGHTEFLAELTGSPMPVMLLTAERLRVALVTTHLPLADVPAAITGERVEAVLDVLHDGLVQRFGIETPEIAVCGLNPHAGEGGHLGREDADVIRPVIEAFRARGLHVRGPLPADTVFTPAGGRADAVLAMYHDQGLPVLKYAGFGHAVNVTLGLPIIRTSVDHGTALDIAGSGDADAGSLLAAMRLARELR